jgi:hypothetical protein
LKNQSKKYQHNVFHLISLSISMSVLQNDAQRFCARRRKGIESTSACSLPKDEDSNNDEETTKALLSF